MAKLRLTDSRIKTLNPAKTTRDVRDAVLRGFGVRILPSGGKRFFIHTQFNGQRVWKLIGDADMMGVADAREAARSALAAVRKGQPVVASPDETSFEAVYVGDYETFEDVVADLPTFIEDIYNETRLHSALGYLSPNTFEKINAPDGTKSAE